MDQPIPSRATIPTTSPQSGEAPPPADNSDLLPELRPIAEKHGREMLQFAIRVSGANSSLDVLIRWSQRNMHMRPPTLMLMDSFQYMAQELAKAKGWDWELVMHCIQDIGAAAKAKSLEPKLVDATGSRILKA